MFEKVANLARSINQSLCSLIKKAGTELALDLQKDYKMYSSSSVSIIGNESSRSLNEILFHMKNNAIGIINKFSKNLLIFVILFNLIKNIYFYLTHNN